MKEQESNNDASEKQMQVVNSGVSYFPENNEHAHIFDACGKYLRIKTPAISQNNQGIKSCDLRKKPSFRKSNFIINRNHVGLMIDHAFAR